MLRRSKPMPRSTFKPRRIVRAAGPDVEREIKPLAKAPNYGGTTSGVAVAKRPMLQHEGYMAAVRLLGYCMLCRRSCHPQFCHRDQGKGMGLKTDVREGWPGCDECHYYVGTSGKLAKDDRRELELRLGAQTRNAVNEARMWPARLPQWTTVGDAA